MQGGARGLRGIATGLDGQGMGGLQLLRLSAPLNSHTLTASCLLSITVYCACHVAARAFLWGCMIAGSLSIKWNSPLLLFPITLSF